MYDLFRSVLVEIAHWQAYARFYKSEYILSYVQLIYTYANILCGFSTVL